MKKLIILSLLFLPFALQAQSFTEYNRKGDEAMARNDFRDAKIWYEEGVSNCNSYSIDKLTDIWMQDESMRVSMQTVMSKCFDCLNDQAFAKNQRAIEKIIIFYSEGIGTVKNEDSANNWKEQLEQLRRPVTDIYIPQESKENMKFFAGYHASLIAPFGIQVGGLGKSVGWYVRLHSNFTFQSTPYDCEIDKIELKIQQFDDKDFYRATGRTKSTYMMGSVGIMVKTVSTFYVSAGVGFWDRKFSREFIRVDDSGTDQPASTGWARDKDNSMNGITINLDGTYVFSERFYGTMGASLMSFKYVYPSIGVGIFF